VIWSAESHSCQLNQASRKAFDARARVNPEETPF